ncbi:MAG: tetratricopeptide repeat protein, partial [Saccharothrix sp.]|nr:tetratricopeptide repeat protein [Saccharothrix sp.]
LLRAYAAERAAAEEPGPEAAAAVRRVLTWYLHSAFAADRVITPQRRSVPLEPLTDPLVRPVAFASHDAAVDWCATELANLVAATRAAAEVDPELAWRIPTALRGFFYLRKPWPAWITTHELGLAAARRVGHLAGQAWMHANLAGAHLDLEHVDQAVDHYERAIAIRRDTGDDYGVGMALQGLAMAYRQGGRIEDALAALAESLTTARAVGNRYNEGLVLHSLGEVHLARGSYAEADDCLDRALAVRRDIGDLWGAGITLNTRGDSLLRQGRPVEAAGRFQEALEAQTGIDSRSGVARSLAGLGAARRAAGDLDGARDYLTRALAVFDELGSPSAQHVRDALTRLGAAG